MAFSLFQANIGSHAQTSGTARLESLLHGFSLFECLIASAISVVILLAAFRLYADCYQLLLEQRAYTTWQQQGKFLTNFMRIKISRAGWMGCIEPGQLDLTRGLRGLAYATAPSALRRNLHAGSDVLVLGECEQVNGESHYRYVDYYVGKTTRKNAQGAWVESLFSDPVGGSREEVLADLKDLHIRYALQQGDSVAGKWYAAAEVRDWSKVRLVKLEFSLLPLAGMGGVVNQNSEVIWSVYSARGVRM